MRAISLIMILFSIHSAHAGILFEPYVGYSMGDIKSRGALTHPDIGIAGQDRNGSADGFAYGGRLGYQFGYFFLGGDYLGTRAKLKIDGDAEAVNWNNSTVFGVLGLDLLMGLRLTAGMSVMEHRSEEGTTPERTRYIGKAKKLGLSYRYRAPFAVNADYVIYELDKFKVGPQEGALSQRFEDFKYSAIVLSISFPFEI